MYIHERPEWPKLHWNSEALTGLLAEVRHRQGRLLGQMQALGFGLREEAVLRTLTEDVVKSSAIEGQELDPAAVRSSIARRLGMDVGGLKPADRNVEGVVEMMLDATRNYDKPADGRAAVRLARKPVPDRAQRHAAHNSRRVAQRQRRPDAGRVRSRSAKSGFISRRRKRRVLRRK